MERTIKNFNKFTKDLWEEFAMNFLNSIEPNPFEVLGNIDDIFMEYLDMGYSYFSLLEIINIDNNYPIGTDAIELLHSELTAENISGTPEKILKYSPGSDENFRLIKCIESGKYKLVYKFGFHSKEKYQTLGEMIDEVYYPMMKRIGNEYSLNILNYWLDGLRINFTEDHSNKEPDFGFLGNRLKSNFKSLILITELK